MLKEIFLIDTGIVIPFIPDSIGLIARYLYPYYQNDIQIGALADDKAKEYLQELFLMLQSRIHVSSDRFYRGGESHFCVGGYLANGEDGFNGLSRLVVDSLMELPTRIPQISLRWTNKTPTDVLRYMLVCLFETYFKQGGTHFQLTYVSKEDLINAQKTPEKYESLRVRVSGFSDYFVFLSEALQN